MKRSLLCSVVIGSMIGLVMAGFGPVFEWQIGGHDQAVSLVRCRDDIGLEFGSGLAGGDVLDSCGE